MVMQENVPAYQLKIVLVPTTKLYFYKLLNRHAILSFPLQIRAVLQSIGVYVA